jgi:hypothetical protein
MYINMPQGQTQKRINMAFFGLLLVFLLLPLLYASATSIGNNVSVTGNTTIGDATTDTLTVTARLASDLDPNANNTIDLGAFGLAYNNFFASGTVYLASVTSTMIEPWVNNTSDLGSFGKAWNDVFTSGTLYAATTTIVAGDLNVDSGTLLVDESANKVGIVSSTPSSVLSVGSNVTGTTTFDFSKPCFRMYVNGSYVYYYPSTSGANAAVSGWATSTASCF